MTKIIWLNVAVNNVPIIIIIIIIIIILLIFVTRRQ